MKLSSSRSVRSALFGESVKKGERAAAAAVAAAAFVAAKAAARLEATSNVHLARPSSVLKELALGQQL